ncbi:MAG: AI-2E family transporter [Woeseiaceae bacterium]|nr:AI-2E family transporter [Woeseiaceae bacterium]
MMISDSTAADRNFQKNALASFVQIAAVALLVVWCWRILEPFVSIILWGMIIAVALYPLHVSLSARMAGSEKLSATSFVLAGLAIILVPSIVLAESTYVHLFSLGEQLRSGAVSIPPPKSSVAEWPVIGKQVYAAWAGAASNLADTLNAFGPQLREFGGTVVRFTGSLAGGVLQFVASVIIAGVFLVYAEGSRRASLRFATSLVGDRGEALNDLAIATIRSVAKGVLGVAMVQALLAAIGFVVMDIPAAGVWTVVVLMLGIMQIPQLIIMGPIAVWVFSVAEPVPASIFLVYALFVSISDGFLKPMFLGRGVEIPMLVILLGAIGGMIHSGIIGLFTGAVVLAIGYQILLAWMDTDELNNPRQTAAGET